MRDPRNASVLSQTRKTKALRNLLTAEALWWNPKEKCCL